MKVLAVAVLPWLVSLGHAQAPTVSNTGSTRGLVAKFGDVKAFGATIRTRYYEMGQGEPMVLAHGGGFDGRYSANHWDTSIPGLGKRFHVFAPDKLAAGMTDNPPDDKDLNIQGEVEHMYQFIQTMKLGKVHLVGQSRGAGLALLFAVLHPEVVKTLVLIDSATASPEDACPGCVRIARDPCPTGDPDEFWKCLMRNLCFHPRWPSTTSTGRRVTTWQACRRRRPPWRKRRLVPAGQAATASSTVSSTKSTRRRCTSV
jgi:pimeloyl-ACP methyl ester carboxylesterase